MRAIPSGLAGHLGGGVTTLCRCWRLTRRDGASLGFTDHDRDLLVDGQGYAARTGVEAADAASELGFVIGGGDVAGALTSEAITEADVAAGLYDDAAIELRLVNWSDLTQSLLLSVASIGEIRRTDDSFVAEMRGPMHRFDEEHGLVYRATCSADLGDARCGVNLAGLPFAADAAVATTDGALRVTASGLAGLPDGWFTAGRLVWSAGSANVGTAVEVKVHRDDAAGTLLELWQRAPRPIRPGDPFRVSAGCDKRLATCRDKFGTVANHRGFPHMPGNDFVVRAVLAGEPGLDGGSLFR